MIAHRAEDLRGRIEALAPFVSIGNCKMILLGLCDRVASFRTRAFTFLGAFEGCISFTSPIAKQSKVLDPRFLFYFRYMRAISMGMLRLNSHAKRNYFGVNWGPARK
jgi:hypothetical protein